MPTVTYGSATDVGCVREHNEDRFLAAPGVFVVADGMGGHAAGEVAAEIAVSELAALASRTDVDPAEVVAVLDAVNDRVLQTEAERPETAGMGTTVTGAVLTMRDGQAQWIVLNVGDSRTYLRSGGVLGRVTVDHSEVEELVQAGFITEAQARVHPRRNVVTRSIGSVPGPVADVWLLPAVAGDRLLVCSDGLTNEVEDAEIEEVLGSEASVQEIAQTLVERARIAGGHDNITAVVVEIG